MESGAAASSYPLHSWHPHVYAQPPKSPTPHSIAHILGIRDDTRNNDQPLNLSCPGRTTQPSSPGLAASPRASSTHDAKTAPSPLPALGTPSLPHADAQLALPKGESVGVAGSRMTRAARSRGAQPGCLPGRSDTCSRARAHNRCPAARPPRALASGGRAPPSPLVSTTAPPPRWPWHKSAARLLPRNVVRRTQTLGTPLRPIVPLAHVKCGTILH
ncbi:hypothetical protein HPB49_022171 [Dermacentor silvarum]|uniref:Uncharacterized protein n=1 Tax=Dermacentor silvarum TaxID=543639 RepID=A0ACB8E3B1_DERSI|nr:hypothetical protein HPB49_022171 [Dermacentor silvarum]